MAGAPADDRRPRAKAPRILVEELFYPHRLHRLGRDSPGFGRKLSADAAADKAKRPVS
jgi:hypothetical protein